MYIGKNNTIQGSELSVVSGVYWGSWNVFLQLLGVGTVLGLYLTIMSLSLGGGGIDCNNDSETGF